MHEMIKQIIERFFETFHLFVSNPEILLMVNEMEKDQGPKVN